MRIRTDDEYAHREDTIQSAADELDCNKTRAVLISCEVTSDVLPALEDALADADIRPSMKREIADAVSSHNVSVDVERETVTVDTD